jgi:hypothetical protein
MQPFTVRSLPWPTLTTRSGWQPRPGVGTAWSPRLAPATPSGALRLPSLASLGVQVTEVVGIVATAGGGGHYLVGSDSGLFTLGESRAQVSHRPSDDVLAELMGKDLPKYTIFLGAWVRTNSRTRGSMHPPPQNRRRAAETPEVDKYDMQISGFG